MNKKASNPERFISLLVLLVPAGFYTAVAITVPEFEKLFVEMEVELPANTQLVLSTYSYWLIFLVIGILGFFTIAWRKNSFGWYLLAPSALSVLVMLPILVWAMYGPVLNYVQAT